MATTPKRGRNFTEGDKLLLIEVAKKYVSIIDNKKTDGTTVEAKKVAWYSLTLEYNASSSTGARTEKQLHALYDFLKKKARRNHVDDKCEIYKTGGGTFCPKVDIIDEKVKAMLIPQFTPLRNPYDSSASYYSDPAVDSQPVATAAVNIENVCYEDLESTTLMEEEPQAATLMEEQPQAATFMEEEPQAATFMKEEPQADTKAKRTKTFPSRETLTANKRKAINLMSSAIAKRKSNKQENDDLLVQKKAKLLDLQIAHEEMKIAHEEMKKEKVRQILEAELQQKLILLEMSRIDLDRKKNSH